jgi:hypothetical protein
VQEKTKIDKMLFHRQATNFFATLILTLFSAWYSRSFKMAMNNGASTSNNRKRRADHPSMQIASVSEGEPHSKYVLYMLKYIQGRMCTDKPQQQQFRYPFIHDVGNYDKVMKIGQGTFG